MGRWQSWLLLCLSLFYGVAQATEFKGARVWPDPNKTRVVIDLDQKVSYSYFPLVKPDRLVVDLHDTSLKSKLPMTVTNSPILTKIRTSGAPEKGTLRLVFELKKGTLANVFPLAPTPDGHYGHRLVVDLPHGGAVAASDQKDSANTAVAAKVPQGMANIIVAIDAGHGGEDPGAIGPKRKYEKHATLAIARRLAAKINATPGMEAVLTRRGDYYVDLNRRTEIARQKKAHMLISIHADGFRSPQPRGGSVWVLSTRRANSEIGRWIEDHEKQSELLGGGDVIAQNTEDLNLNRTLLDLKFANSTKEGNEVALRILKNMSKVTVLHKRKPEYASLAVLKSPDIPSVLVETGFISNPGEEKLLFQNSHQEKLANAIYQGVLSYFRDYPPEGTRFASSKPRKHKVKSGESLSVIAEKYGTSVASIKSANKLKSSQLRVGQVLQIPSARLITPPSTQQKASTSIATRTVVHVVGRGEFLGKIAEKYGVSVASIRSLNRLKSDELAIGQKLKIAVPASKSVKHKVKSGEHLSGIADHYGVSMQALKKANRLKRDTLYVGQVLIIPSH
ncbi:LysM peptidoglycan-binding domain-containing protein [Vibrio stylophorae]|uniref:LysM peptidoglycan-binding domain-containing protein n=1 Tax=Vibrio stylophorae TaxID=659351 RepID=UPI001F015F97|nr:N-acetylmuramoyl-L-alanine amidase [Vibrio stylophorae]